MGAYSSLVSHCKIDALAPLEGGEEDAVKVTCILTQSTNHAFAMFVSIMFLPNVVSTRTHSWGSPSVGWLDLWGVSVFLQKAISRQQVSDSRHLCCVTLGLCVSL